jgi:hypothetical protein
MTFDDLCKKGLIEKYQVSRKEINGILDAAKADIKTAQNFRYRFYLHERFSPGR